MVPDKRQIIYLACPYTHPSAAVRRKRFRVATKVAAAYIRSGLIVFSPITMTHPIDVVMAGDLGTLGSDFWVTFDEAFMDACSEMRIIDVDGWTTSSGIRREIAYFRASGKPVVLARHDDPQDLRPIEIGEDCTA